MKAYIIALFRNFTNEMIIKVSSEFYEDLKIQFTELFQCPI